MTHTLTVTRCEPDDDDIEYQLTGPHDDSCAVWMPCCDNKPDADDLDGHEEQEWHGVEHKFIEGAWMTRTEQCGGRYDCDDAWDIARKRGVGSHPVDIDYYGDGSWRMLDATPSAAVRP